MFLYYQYLFYVINIFCNIEFSQGWARRRGSAPVGLLSKFDDSTPTSISTKIDHNCRRGSVPTDMTRQGIHIFYLSYLVHLNTNIIIYSVYNYALIKE